MWCRTKPTSTWTSSHSEWNLQYTDLKNQALTNRIRDRDLQAAAALHESQMVVAVSKAEVQLMKQMMGNKLQTPNSHDKSGSGSHHLDVWILSCD